MHVPGVAPALVKLKAMALWGNRTTPAGGVAKVPVLMAGFDSDPSMIIAGVAAAVPVTGVTRAKVVAPSSAYV